MANPVITKKAAEDLQLGKNGSYSNEGNVLQHVVYDNMDFQNTTLRAETTFFSIPIGGTYMGGTKTLAETNLREVGKLPNGQTFLVKEIGFAFIPTLVGSDLDYSVILAAFYNIMQASTVEIKIAGREYDLQVPGTVFLNPVQATARATIVTATDRQAQTGQFISTGWIKLNSTPIPIGQMVTFNVLKKSGSAVAANATILDTASDVLDTQEAQEQCRLRGILTRAI